VRTVAGTRATGPPHRVDVVVELRLHLPDEHPRQPTAGGELHTVLGQVQDQSRARRHLTDGLPDQQIGGSEIEIDQFARPLPHLPMVLVTGIR